MIIALAASSVPSPAIALESAPNNSRFKVKFDSGAIVSLQSADDSFHTEFVMPNRRLGDAFIRYRKKGGEWKSADSSALKDSGVYSISDDGEKCSATYQITNGDSAALELNIGFSAEKSSVIWTLKLENKTGEPLEIGDFAVSLPMNSASRRGSSWVLKHSFISGDGSFLFWMRPDSARPYLVMMPRAGTHLEYWDARNRNYRVFIHSAAAGEEAKTHGTNWRQPNTSVTLSPSGTSGDACAYGFQFHWANDYDGVRETLFDNGGIDVQVVPGMTIPSDLTARFALRTKQKIHSVGAEFPEATEIKSLGTNGDYRLFQVKFSRLGENRLEVHYGDKRSMFLEFFSAEPIETLIKKRG
ncbi:MAG TPA: DUF5695 domain-containing protein, partial [Verrucomicrobiae bacterium]|nr:DUF5695 domain-containing protein [Verrucomicrobiae bacterium]